MVPSIVGIVTRLSLDATRGLVAGGYGLGHDGERFVALAPPLAIVDATNAAQIVIETAIPHRLVVNSSAHGIIAGVGGNTAANNIDANGYAQAVIAVAVDDTHLAISAVNQTTGEIEAIAGNGAYTSGGTFTPAFTDGGILLGRQHLHGQSAAPRIVMFPVTSRWGSKSVYHGAFANTAEQELQRQIRSIATEKIVFEVHTWGQASPPNPDEDYDSARVLYHQFLRTTHALTAGTYELIDGTWPSGLATTTQLIVAGREHVLHVAVGTPVLDVLLPYAPSDIAALPTTYFQPLGSVSTEQGCSG